MIKLDTYSNKSLFVTLDVGDTFIGGDNKCYIKIPTVTRVKNYEYFGTYNAVCVTSGDLALVVEEQPVDVVQLKAEVIK